MTGSLPSIPPSVGATAKNRPHLSQIPVSQNLDSASSLTPRFRAIHGSRSVTVAAPIKAPRLSKRFPDRTESHGQSTGGVGFSPRGTSVLLSVRASDESEAQ